jgi:hypothetical protein
MGRCHLVESGYAIAFVEADNVFTNGFDNAGDVIATVALFVEDSGKLPVLRVCA